MDNNSCTTSQIDGLIVQFQDFKSKASKLLINLNSINEKLRTGNYVQQDLLINTKNTIEEYNELQNGFYHNMKECFYDFPIGNFDEIEKFLNDSNKTYIYQESVASLVEFLSVNIDNEDVYTKLHKCKDNVLNILMNKDIEKVIESSIPYKLFINLMDIEADDISIEEEEAIEEVFPKPIPRMLFSKQFYIDQKFKSVLNQEADAEITENEDKNTIEYVEQPEVVGANEQIEIDEKAEIVTNKEESTKVKDFAIENKTEKKEEAIAEKEKDIATDEKEKNEETVESKEKTSEYSYNTRKQQKQFSVSVFKNDMQNLNKPSLLKLLYYICLFRLLTESHIKKYVFDGDTAKMDIIINQLHRGGYLTEIINKSTLEKCYCLAKRGVQVFERIGSRSEFVKARKLIDVQLLIPDTSISDYNLRNNEDIIKKYVTLNDVTLVLREELDKLEFIATHIIYNKETADKSLPYSLLTTINYLDMKLNLLVLEADVFSDLSVEELSSILELNFIDIIFCIIKDSLDIGEQKTLILYNKRFYNVKNSIDYGQLSFIGIDGTVHTLTSILQSLNHVADDSESKKEAALETEAVVVNTTAEIQKNNHFQTSIVIDIETESSVKGNEADNESIKITDVTFDKTTKHPDNSYTEYESDLNTKQYPYKCEISSVVKLLSEERLVEAIVLAKALSFIPNNDNFNIFYNRLLYATNMSIDNHEYSSDKISTLDNKEAKFTDNLSEDLKLMLRLSTFAWALLVPDVPHGHLLYNYKDSVIADAEYVKSISPSIKSVYEILFEVCEYSPTGFSNSVVSSLINEKQNMLINQRLKSHAKGLLDYKMPNYKAIGVPELYKTCFDNSSDLGKCMHIISESDEKSMDFVKELFDSFDEGLNDTISISNSRIEDYIDNLWDNVDVKKSSHKKLDKLPNEIRKSVFNNIKSRLEIILQWLVINNSINNNAIKNKNKLMNLKKILSSKLESVCNDIEESKESQDEHLKAGLFVLHSTMSKMKDYLIDNKSYHDKWDYVELLKSHYISLDNEYKPVLDKNFQFVEGFEPWRRVIAHINSKKVEYTDALKLIDSSDNDEWFNNYNSAICIGEHLFETSGFVADDYSNAIKQAINDSKKEQDNFRGDLELAYAYGCIEESSKEDILRAIDDLSGDLIETGNFANHRAFINSLRQHIKSHSEKRKAELNHRKIQLNNNLIKIDESVLNAIEKNLEEQNFTVAEEYLNRIEIGDSSLTDELINESVTDVESEYHERFINNYDFFFKLCRKNVQENVIAKWGEKGINSQIRNFSQGQRNNSRQLLESWPKGRESKTLIMDVKKLLDKFGFNVNAIKADSSYKKCELFNADIAPKLKNLEDYSHPIARFGTQISEPVSVLCLFGRTYSSPNSLKEIFIDESLKLSDCTFVLVDAAFSLNERRQIAELLKADIQSMNSFIIIDRVLMLYFATLDSSKWLSALLKCTLPYTYCQPYVQRAGVVADEMFFGRKAELHNIRDYNGACLVYGGRQLGKTALLKRACTLMHNPEFKKHAFYIDIKACKSKQAFSEIYNLLKENNIVKEPCSDFEVLCSLISKKLSSGEISELQIYIDEADDFLEDISSDDYEELKPFKKLRDRFPNRFKIVFAGLHRVAHNKNNSVIIHLGTPLCIKPFSTSDAKNLIERPLSYLGFRFVGDEGKKQLSLIMANTNYYPGLLHLFCYKLVESTSENYKAYYSATKQNPPYVISEEHLKKLFFNTRLNEETKDFFIATLSLDPRYKLIANIIAYLSYRGEEENTIHPEGFHIHDIKSCEEIQLTSSMKDTEFETLLQEMVEMGILWNKPGTKFYRLRRNSFLEMLGSYDDVFSYIYSATEGVY